MKIYGASVLLYAYRLEEVLQIAHGAGYAGVEIWHYHLLQTGESPAKLRRQAQALGLDLAVHALSWDLNFTSQLPTIREESLRLLESSIEAAAELAAQPVVVHPGRITAPNDDVDLDRSRLIEGVARLSRRATAVGTRLSMELMEQIPKEFFIAPEDALRLQQSFDASDVSITFDAAHVPWSEEPLDYLFRTAGVEHIHLSDATEDRLHLALGEGHRYFLPLLRHIQSHLNVAVTIEGMEYNRTTTLFMHNKDRLDALIDQIG